MMPGIISTPPIIINQTGQKRRGKERNEFRYRPAGTNVANAAWAAASRATGTRNGDALT